MERTITLSQLDLQETFRITTEDAAINVEKIKDFDIEVLRVMYDNFLIGEFVTVE